MKIITLSLIRLSVEGDDLCKEKKRVPLRRPEKSKLSISEMVTMTDKSVFPMGTTGRKIGVPVDRFPPPGLRKCTCELASNFSRGGQLDTCFDENYIWFKAPSNPNGKTKNYSIRNKFREFA
jgi:hypothetical protein